MPTQIDIDPEVRSALDAGTPVVALESTLITHGLPRPINLEVARRLEDIIRDNGAVPATVAIIGGRIHVGLGVASLEYLARAASVRKVSRRDLPIIVAQKGDGATTVAATMWVGRAASWNASRAPAS